MTCFEILGGLPPYGPVALPFPPGSLAAHSEGFVVRFQPDAGVAWVGNFQRGFTWFDSVLTHPDGFRLVVIAKGAGYVIDPNTREQVFHGGADAILSEGGITSVTQLSDVGILLLWDGFRLGALKAGAEGWTSNLITTDGAMRSAVTDGTRLHVEVNSVDDFDGWCWVELDLATGRVTRNPMLY